MLDENLPSTRNAGPARFESLLTTYSLFPEARCGQGQTPRILHLHPERLRARCAILPPSCRPRHQRGEEYVCGRPLRCTPAGYSIWRSLVETRMESSDALSGRDSKEWRRATSTATHIPDRVCYTIVQPRHASDNTATDDEMEQYRELGV